MYSFILTMFNFDSKFWTGDALDTFTSRCRNDIKMWTKLPISRFFNITYVYVCIHFFWLCIILIPSHWRLYFDSKSLTFVPEGVKLAGNNGPGKSWSQLAWWCHEMEAFSFPPQRVSNADFDVSLMRVRLNVLTNRRMASPAFMWRHCNGSKLLSSPVVT